MDRRALAAACVIACAACATGSKQGARRARSPVAAPEPDPDPRKKTIELAFAGDVMFGRYVAGGFRPIVADQHDLFAGVATLLDSDFTMVNLETPVMRDPPAISRWGHDMRFVATPAQVASLRVANIDAVTVANNHAFDMRAGGLAETPAILDELGIVHVGAQRTGAPLVRVETIEVAGWKVGYLAVTGVRNWLPDAAIGWLPFVRTAQLRRAVVPVIEAERAAHDLIIVTVHWGTEYADKPSSRQVATAHAFIDAGADAVIGHHPHVIQGIERYRGGVIAYSLGNFLFDNLSGTKRLHGILRLRFRRDGSCLASAAYHPTVGTRPYYAPVPAGDDFNKVAGRLRKLSKARPLTRTDWKIDGARLVAAGACATP